MAHASAGLAHAGTSKNIAARQFSWSDTGRTLLAFPV